MKDKTASFKGIRAGIKEKEIVFLGLILFLICSVAGLLLGVTYENTKELIAEKKDAVTKAAYQKVLPGDSSALTAVDIDEAYQADILEAYRSPGIGYAIKVQGKGYAGDAIEIALGISEDGKITGVTIISHSETPGLGARATEPEFLGQFAGRTADQTLKVVKSAVNIDEIDAISGATKTSNGVTAAVNIACRFYNECLKGGKSIG